jgi:hypothetical protein
MSPSKALGSSVTLPTPLGTHPGAPDAFAAADPPVLRNGHGVLPSGSCPSSQIDCSPVAASSLAAGRRVIRAQPCIFP